MQWARVAVCVSITVAAGAAHAQDAAPDLGFLEYLGSWEESDEEWLIVAEVEEELEQEDEESPGDGKTDEQDEK